MFFVFLLILISVYDCKYRLIPDRLLFFLSFAGCVWLWLSGGFHWLEMLTGAFSVSVPMMLLCLIIPGGFGGGDIKLMAACGMMLGWKRTWAAFFYAVMLAGVYCVWLIAHGKGRKAEFAFGPFLAAGVLLTVGIGDTILWKIWHLV